MSPPKPPAGSSYSHAVAIAEKLNAMSRATGKHYEVRCHPVSGTNTWLVHRVK